MSCFSFFFFLSFFQLWLGRVRLIELLQGDIIFCDPLEGVVVIPRDLLDQVLETMPKLIAVDDKVKEAVEQGSSVQDAFKKFRG